MDLERFKNIAIVITPYIILCGYLYFVSYFHTFGINGLVFIGYSDVIQIVAFTFCLTFGIALLLTTFINILLVDLFGMKGGSEVKNPRKYLLSKWTLLFILFVWIFMVWLKYPTQEESAMDGEWFFWGTFSGLFPYLYIDRSNFLDDLKPSLRTCLIQFLVFLPILSWGLGKYDSYTIKNNISYNYVLENKIPKKIVLLSSKDIILVTLNNDSLTISERTSSDKITILKKVDL